MSLTGTSPLIKSWIEQGLEWRWLGGPVFRPFTIPAGGQIQVPSEEYTFRAPEGALLIFNATFDHPDCGLRAEMHPEFDSGDSYTVRNLIAYGGVNFPIYLTAIIPPQSPPGIYSIASSKEWTWTDWLRLYLINTGSVGHRCLAYEYTVVVLKKPRHVAQEG